MAHMTLLLNLAVLVVTFAVALGSADAQVRVLRTTARVACAAPVPPARPEPRGPAAGPATRLAKYVGRGEGLGALTPAQVQALCAAAARCSAELARGGAMLGAGRIGGTEARTLLAGIEDRARRDVAAALRAAGPTDGELVARLVRIVLASAG